MWNRYNEGGGMSLKEQPRSWSAGLNILELVLVPSLHPW